jgi:hypothetical protein
MQLRQRSQNYLSALAVSEAWIGLIGALAGVIVTSVTSLLTLWFGQRRDEQKWRHERQDARRVELQKVYVRFLMAAQRFYAHVGLLDMSFLQEVANDKERQARLNQLVDAKIRESLDEAGLTAQLLSSERMHDEITRFQDSVLEAAVSMAASGQAARNGFDALSRPLIRGINAELRPPT